LGFRYLAGGERPDHWTLDDFRRRHPKALNDLFTQVLELAWQAGLGRLGHVAIDSTRLKANASPQRVDNLRKLRYYDLRYLCVTEMLEAGIPEVVIREVAGHIDPAMTRHYSHPRLAARRAAVGALSTVRRSPNQAPLERG
jgi:integrase